MPCARPRRAARVPRPRSPGPPRPRRRAQHAAQRARRFVGSGWSSSHCRRGGAGRRRGSATGRPGRRRAARAAPSSSARPSASTTTSSPSSTADRAATRTASPASSGSAVGEVDAPSGPRSARRRRPGAPTARRRPARGGRPRWARTGSQGVERIGAGRRPHRGHVARARRAPARAGGASCSTIARPMVARRPPADRLSRRTAPPVPAGRRPTRRSTAAHRRVTGGARAASRPSRRPVPPRRPVRPAPVARRRDRRVHGQGVAPRPRRLPPVDLVGPDRRLRARPPAHARRRERTSRPRFSPDGWTLAFLSDRRLLVEEEPDRPKDAKERDDCDQVHLLPLDGGEARRLTDLPRGVTDVRMVARRPTLAVLTSSLGATMPRRSRAAGAGRRKPKPGETPLSDYRYIDRLGVPVQRRRLHRRPRRAPVAGRRRDRRRAAAGRRPDGRGEPAWSPGRHPDRVHRRTAGRNRTSTSARRSSSSTSRRAR